MEKCSNCGRAIRENEEAFLFEQKVVCAPLEHGEVVTRRHGHGVAGGLLGADPLAEVKLAGHSCASLPTTRRADE